VALTASYLPERGQELFEAGIDNYMAKPFNVAHLRHILQYGLESRKAREASNSDLEKPNPTITEPVIQEVEYQLGVQLVGGDIETYKELLNDFMLELPEKLKAMQVCYEKKDKEGLYRAAHNLKGVSANLGALQLSEHAHKLEKQVGESYTEGVIALLNDISIAAEKLRMRVLVFLADQELKAG
jgi:two-component system sensor histidine kinase BarA